MAVRVCGDCGYIVEDSEDQLCSKCGTDLLFRLATPCRCVRTATWGEKIFVDATIAPFGSVPYMTDMEFVQCSRCGDFESGCLVADPTARRLETINLPFYSKAKCKAELQRWDDPFKNNKAVAVSAVFHHLETS